MLNLFQVFMAKVSPAVDMFTRLEEVFATEHERQAASARAQLMIDVPSIIFNNLF